MPCILLALAMLVSVNTQQAFAAGLEHHQSGRLEEAIALYQQVIASEPGNSQAHCNLGTALQGLGRFSEAIAALHRAIDLHPQFAVARYNLANCFVASGRYDEARQGYLMAVELDPDFAAAWNNLGEVFLRQGTLDAAGAVLARAIELRPNYADAMSNLACVTQRLGFFDEALQRYNRAIELDPLHAYAHVGRGGLLLLNEYFEQGWRDYEWRWNTKEMRPRQFQQPMWTGEPLGGRTILLHAEQFLGDTILFVRYAKLIKIVHQDCTVIVECQGALTKLLKTCDGIDQLIAAGEPIPKFDTHLPLMSVPMRMGTRLESIPAQVPYLFSDREMVKRWSAKLEPMNGFRVGVNWRGRSATRHRDLPLESLANLAKIPNVRLISLQRGEGRDDLLAADNLPIIDLGDDFDTRGAFMDTAAVMMILDLVITSDTSIAHLAGALGVPVWVVLPFVPEWIWLADRSDSPWYPTMRLFRQSTPGNWHDPFSKVAAELQSLV